MEEGALFADCWEFLPFRRACHKDCCIVAEDTCQDLSTLD